MPRRPHPLFPWMSPRACFWRFRTGLFMDGLLEFPHAILLLNVSRQWIRRWTSQHFWSRRKWPQVLWREGKPPRFVIAVMSVAPYRCRTRKVVIDSLTRGHFLPPYILSRRLRRSRFFKCHSTTPQKVLDFDWLQDQKESIRKLSEDVKKINKLETLLSRNGSACITATSHFVLILSSLKTQLFLNIQYWLFHTWKFPHC